MITNHPSALYIADIHFDIASHLAIKTQDIGRHYRPFLIPSETSQQSISIHLKTSNDFHIGDDKQVLFKTEKTWGMYAQDKQYHIAMRATGKKEIIGWDAYCNQAFNYAEIYIPDKTLYHWVKGSSGIPALQYPLDEILLFHYLSLNHGLLIHSASVKINNTGWLFSGPSGAGKSTISRLLSQSKNVVLMNDDRNILRRENTHWSTWGTPWYGDNKETINTNWPLTAICFLKHGSEFQLTRLNTTDALHHLIPVSSIPWHLEKCRDQALSTCGEIVKDIPIFELTFSLNEKKLVEKLVDSNISR